MSRDSAKRFPAHRVLLSLGVLVLALSGCGPRETAVEAGRRTQTLHVGNGAEPRDLDPHVSVAYTDYNILIALFEGLTVIDEETSQPIPGTAERWEISPDGLVYTFYLRPEARWSNGDPVTAPDFAFSFERLISPQLASEYAYMFSPVAGAEAFMSGQTRDFSQVGVKVLDERTLQITLARPTPYLLSLAAHQSWFPVHPPTILKHGSAHQRGTRWTRVENFVGNGAYRLQEWSRNSRIVVTHSPTYWDAAATRVQTVVLYPTEKIDTDERNFRAGQVHLTYDLLPEKIPVYQREAPEKIRVDPFLESFFLRFNITRPPLNNPKVRQALARGIDRQAICETVLQGSRTPAHALVPPNTAGYTPTAHVPSDFDAARRLLAEAGYPGGRGLPPLSAQMNADEINQKVLEAIQEMWRRELGVTLTLSQYDFRVYIDNQQSLNYEISRSRWVGDYNDPSTFTDLFLSDGGNNNTGWKNPTYDRLIQEAARTLDNDRRFALLQQAETLLLEEAPIIPVFYGTRVFLIHPSVKGWVPSLLGIHRYQKIWLE